MGKILDNFSDKISAETRSESVVVFNEGSEKHVFTFSEEQQRDIGRREAITKLTELSVEQFVAGNTEVAEVLRDAAKKLGEAHYEPAEHHARFEISYEALDDLNHVLNLERNTDALVQPIMTNAIKRGIKRILQTVDGYDNSGWTREDFNEMHESKLWLERYVRWFDNGLKWK